MTRNAQSAATPYINGPVSSGRITEKSDIETEVMINPLDERRCNSQGGYLRDGSRNLLIEEFMLLVRKIMRCSRLSGDHCTGSKVMYVGDKHEDIQQLFNQRE